MVINLAMGNDSSPNMLITIFNKQKIQNIISQLSGSILVIFISIFSGELQVFI